jgi:hypothetical protein
VTRVECFRRLRQKLPLASIFAPPYDEGIFGLLILDLPLLHARLTSEKASDGMVDGTEPEPDGVIPANDNRGPDGKQDEPDRETRRQLDQVALTIARLIGRRMAREQFAALNAANDNRPKDA